MFKGRIFRVQITLVIISSFLVITFLAPKPTVSIAMPVDTLTVINTTDNGPGNLRQAILDATNRRCIALGKVQCTTPSPKINEANLIDWPRFLKREGLWIKNDIGPIC